jgi:hypothetical protein
MPAKPTPKILSSRFLSSPSNHHLNKGCTKIDSLITPNVQLSLSISRTSTALVFGQQSEDPVYKRGIQMVKNGSHVLIGISPRNPYFTDPENLRQLLGYFRKKAKALYIIVPDKPAVHTFRAIGSKDPDRRAKLDVQRLKRKVMQALKE